MGKAEDAFRGSKFSSGMESLAVHARRAGNPCCNHL